ncbi:alpha/beta hydrolase [Mucilaginibacter sp. HMF5004]|uniref:alpha/beta hydrolase n=1 Tax=Mucilaginibacter rivuli TaxID=2857527 RepID=UPI001C5ED23B|nr:alpha/beta hydrolase [Mucilaginibacter rivuli]MBW4889591.1 alpha/beta hydrolase [Mucilaginibacter rivuli]
MVIPKVFLISGMGADERLFRHLDLSGFEAIPVIWIEPQHDDTLATYATRLIRQFSIKAGDSVIGVSLGGMMATEIAKQLELKHVILISSIKSPAEAPAYYNFFKSIPMYKLLSGEFMIKASFLFKPVMGKMAGIHADLFYSMLKNTSPTFLKWSIGASLNWDNTIVPPNITHLIGDADKVFNYKRIKYAIVIRGGDHMMVFNRSKQISPIVREVLSK